MEVFYEDSISDNTTDTLPEEPDIESGSDGENIDSENEEVSGGGETGDTETSGGTPSGGESGSPAEVIGGNDSPTDVGAFSPDDLRQAVDGLNVLTDALSDGMPDYEMLLDSVRSLVDIMTVQAEHADSSAIPLGGYDSYSYPIYVTYTIFPTSLGNVTGNSSTYDTPESFETGYARMWNSVENGSLAYFYIESIRDSEGETVYDVNALPEEEEMPEELDTFNDDVLAALSGIREDLQSISMNDLEYHEQYIEMYEQYTEMQERNTDLQYHMLATNIVIGFTLMLTLGFTIAHGFLQRMKVG